MVGLAKRTVSAWQRHGAAGCILLLGKNLIHLARRSTSQPDPFDTAYGTDTGSIREIGSLDIKSGNSVHAVRYQPTPEAVIRQAFQSVPITDFSEFTFIDFGSGKGRVILVAGTYSFKEVLGVEFSDELHGIASQNIASFPKALKRCPIRSICCDATQFQMPKSNVVCYLYNPFGPAVLDAVVRKMTTHASHGYKVLVLYFDPEHLSVFERAGFTVHRTDQPNLVILSA